MSYFNIDSKRVSTAIERTILSRNKDSEQYQTKRKEKKKSKPKTTTVRLNNLIRSVIEGCGPKVRWKSCKLPYNATARV